MAKRDENKNEILENPDVLADRIGGAENWIEENAKMVIGAVVVVLLIVGGYFGFNYYRNNQNEIAQRDMFQAVYYFEADSLNLALNGDGNNLGFINIIEDYGITKAANLAHFYAGVSYLRLGKYETAILYLEDFKADDLLVQARAYSLIGDAHMELGQFDNAAKFYNRAANHESNKFFSPTYLMKAALAYEKLDQKDRAREAYDRIITEFWDSAEYQNARKFKARLETNS